MHKARRYVFTPGSKINAWTIDIIRNYTECGEATSMVHQRGDCCSINSHSSVQGMGIIIPATRDVRAKTLTTASSFVGAHLVTVDHVRS